MGYPKGDRDHHSRTWIECRGGVEVFGGWLTTDSWSSLSVRRHRFRDRIVTSDQPWSLTLGMERTNNRGRHRRTGRVRSQGSNCWTQRYCVVKVTTIGGPVVRQTVSDLNFCRETTSVNPESFPYPGSYSKEIPRQDRFKTRSRQVKSASTEDRRRIQSKS